MLVKPANMWCVSRFETIDLITKYKSTCRRVLILAGLLERTFLQKYFLHFVIRLTVPNGGTSNIKPFLVKTPTVVTGFLLYYALVSLVRPQML